MTKLIFFIVMLIAIIGCSSKPSEPVVDVKVTKKYNSAWHYYYYMVDIISKADDIKIKNVSINNGNCEPYYETKTGFSPVPPKKALRFGDELFIRTKKCNVIKVAVDTDKGSWEWNFQP